MFAASSGLVLALHGFQSTKILTMTAKCPNLSFALVCTCGKKIPGRAGAAEFNFVVFGTIDVQSILDSALGNERST